MLGGAVYTVTVVVAAVDPFAFVAVKVYVIVEVGFTVVEPASVDVEKEPGVMATELAFERFQESVLVPAEATLFGDAVKEVMIGTFSTFAANDAVELLLFTSVETAQRVKAPFALDVVLHAAEYSVPFATASRPIKVDVEIEPA
jgi:hypothetical protein